jgi:hypothetical protein
MEQFACLERHLSMQGLAVGKVRGAAMVRGAKKTSASVAQVAVED